MIGTPMLVQAPPLDSSRSALAFLHHFLGSSGDEYAALDDLLREVADAFTATAAGVATFPEGELLVGEGSTPLQEYPDALERLRQARLAVPLGGYLMTLAGTEETGGWLLWLKDDTQRPWTESEAALLHMTGQALSQHLHREGAMPRWAETLDRGLRQQSLEAAARLVRRLAHDFGNILTGILGFSELGLSQQLSPNSPLSSFLTEIHRGAQNGAHYVHQLRTFARRHAATSRACSFAAVLAEEENRLRPLLGANIQLRRDVPEEVPPVTMEAEALRQALAIVLDNAREAIASTGVIEVSARLVAVSARQTREVFGEVHPGEHLEIRVADSGGGLTAEVQRHLLREPYFTTKSRQRGFGLALAYGILTAHRGGLDVRPRLEGGTVARLLVPVAEGRTGSGAEERTGNEAEGRTGCGSCRVDENATRQLPQPVRPSEAAPPRSERVLVVDDDPMILQFVTATLQRAGFRVQAAGSAEEALTNYSNAHTDPFRLVLSDVLMPEVNGIDLAQRLLARDANVRVLFMSGQVPAEMLQQSFGPNRFAFISKPFRPDGLVRAVVSAIG